MPSERVLTLRELNRALLARQLLLRRARLPVPRAIERVGALQAQWPPSPYVALWSRLEGFRREHLFRAIERRRVVKATLMRTTLHHVSAADYLAYAGLYLRHRSAGVARELAKLQEATDVEALARELAAHAAERPRTRPELIRLLGLPRLEPTVRAPWLVWHLLASEAALLHGPPSSRWRRNTGGGTFVPAPAWLGAEAAGGREAAMHLVRRYLAAFGPATRADVSQWTGLPIAALEPALARLPLRHFRDEQGRRLLDLPRAPLPPAATEAPPRFLAKWDSALLAHDDRSRVLPDPYRKTIIRRNGDVLQTVLVDGFVAGAWSLEDGRVVLEPFEPLRAHARRALEAEGRALAAFHAD